MLLDIDIVKVDGKETEQNEEDGGEGTSDVDEAGECAGRSAPMKKFEISHNGRLWMANEIPSRFRLSQGDIPLLDMPLRRITVCAGRFWLRVLKGISRRGISR